MLTISMNDGQVHKFNLKSYEREQALRNIWLEHHPDMSARKKINITTDLKESFTIRLGDVSGIKFDEAQYIKAHVHTGKYRGNLKQGSYA